MVKRYYTLIQRIYQIIQIEFLDLIDDAVLQMIFKAINDTVGFDGLVPTLFVFKAYLRIVKLDLLSLTVT
jgi:hypothetical protein